MAQTAVCPLAGLRVWCQVTPGSADATSLCTWDKQPRAPFCKEILNPWADASPCCCQGDLQVRQYSIISALLLLFLDAASDFSSMSPGARKSRPAHDRGGPLLDHGLEPGSSDVRRPAEVWIRRGSVGFACFLGSVFAWLLTTPPPVPPRLKAQACVPGHCGFGALFWQLVFFQHFWRLFRGLLLSLTSEINLAVSHWSSKISFADVCFGKMSAIMCVRNTHRIFTKMFSASSFATIGSNIVCRSVSGPSSANDHRVTL